MKKKAIIVVSFGTTHEDTLKLNIEKMEELFKQKFLEYDIYRAFTSSMIMKKLRSKGIKVFNIKEILDELKEKNYEEILVQPLHIIPGKEFHDVSKIVSHERKNFKNLILSTPLLNDTEDFKNVADIMIKQFKDISKQEAVVLMGHGTYHFSNTAYAAMNFTFHNSDNDNFFVATVEGFPEIDDILPKLKNYKKIHLIPLMLVAGDHAKNDMASDEEDSWKSILKNNGFEVEIYLKGLGENEDIQKIYIDHALKSLKK